MVHIGSGCRSRAGRSEHRLDVDKGSSVINAMGYGKGEL